MKKCVLFITGAIVSLMLIIKACEEISDNKNNDPVVEESSDYIWDEAKAIQVSLNGNSIAVDPSAGSVSGGKLTINSSGTYLLSGSLSDGQIIVDTEDEEIVRLVLNGVNINCSNNAPLYIKEAKKAVIIIGEDTENCFTDGTTYATSEKEPNAAIFSNSYLAVHGRGSLTVNGNFNDGISGDDGLIINSGKITVNAVDDGIRGKDFLIIRDCNLNINSDGDGLVSDNEDNPEKGYIIIDKGIMSITSTGDGISAYTGLIINDGTFTIKTIGGNSKSEEGPPIPPGGGGTAGGYNGTISAKGLKGLSEVIIKTGEFIINTADDGIHSNGKVTIEKGTFTIASGDDAIHADASVTVNSGTINISGVL